MRRMILLISLISALPLLTLSARGFEGAGAVGHGAGFRGSDYLADQHYYNSAWVDPGYYYGIGPGYGNYVDPNYSSSPGMADDTDALYASYLQSNPSIPPAP